MMTGRDDGLDDERDDGRDDGQSANDKLKCTVTLNSAGSKFLNTVRILSVSNEFK